MCSAAFELDTAVTATTILCNPVVGNRSIPGCRQHRLLGQLTWTRHLATPLELQLQIQPAVGPREQQALLHGGNMQHQPDQLLVLSQAPFLRLDQRPQYGLEAQVLQQRQRTAQLARETREQRPVGKQQTSVSPVYIIQRGVHHLPVHDRGSFVLPTNAEQRRPDLSARAIALDHEATVHSTHTMGQCILLLLRFMLGLSRVFNQGILCPDNLRCMCKSGSGVRVGKGAFPIVHCCTDLHCGIRTTVPLQRRIFAVQMQHAWHGCTEMCHADALTLVEQLHRGMPNLLQLSGTWRSAGIRVILH